MLRLVFARVPARLARCLCALCTLSLRLVHAVSRRTLQQAVQKAPGLSHIVARRAAGAWVAAMPLQRGLSKRSKALNVAAMIRPPPPPTHKFFAAHAHSRGSLGRSTEAHWSLFWWLNTRAKPLGGEPSWTLPPEKRLEASAAAAAGGDAGSTSGLPDAPPSDPWGRVMYWRRRVWHFTETVPAWNIGLLLAILTSALCDMVETELALPDRLENSSGGLAALSVLELTVMVLFTFEFLVRFTCCPHIGCVRQNAARIQPSP